MKFANPMVDYANRQFEVYTPRVGVEQRLLQHHLVPSNI